MPVDKMKNNPNTSPATKDFVGAESEKVTLFGGKYTLSVKAYRKLRTVLPLVVILICALIVCYMINAQFSVAGNTGGRFEIVSADSNEYIELESDGSYTMSGSQKGKWNLSGDIFTFIPESGESFEGRFVDRKYIALVDSNFYAGDIPDGDFVNAHLIKEDASFLTLDSDGKVYEGVADSNNTVGTYLVDGGFVIITINGESTTYLKCGDGITASYYQIS